jgi:hypothetical protein
LKNKLTLAQEEINRLKAERCQTFEDLVLNVESANATPQSSNEF